jgi:hypothetical protein
MQTEARLNREFVAHNPTSELLSRNFNFCMQLQNIMWAGVTRNSCSPKEQQQFMPREQGGHRYLYPKLSRNQIIYACVCVNHPAENIRCPHAQFPTWSNSLILQLLQVPQASDVTSTKISPISHYAAFTPHSTLSCEVYLVRDFLSENVPFTYFNLQSVHDFIMCDFVLTRQKFTPFFKFKIYFFGLINLARPIYDNFWFNMICHR